MNKILVFLIALFIVPAVIAVGVSPPSVEYIFQPGMSDDLHFYFRNNQDRDTTLLANISGELADYAKITSADATVIRPQEKMYVDLHFALPDSIGDPGWHSFSLVATELEATGGTVGARGQVVVPVRFFVQYPGKKLDIKMDAQDAGMGEDVKFKLSITNLGTEAVSNAKATVEIYKGTDKIGEVSTDEFPVDVLGKLTKDLAWNSGSNPQGVYAAKATLIYDGGPAFANATFKIGTLDLDVRNYTRVVGKGIINKFLIELESRWNRNIDNIFADVNVSKGGNTLTSFSSAMQTLGPWAIKNMTGFLDATGLSEGTYDIQIRLNFSSEGIERSKIVDGQIQVVGGEKIAPEMKANETKKGGFALSKYLTTINLLILIVIVLVIINIIILIRKKKKNENQGNTYI